MLFVIVKRQFVLSDRSLLLLLGAPPCVCLFISFLDAEVGVVLFSVVTPPRPSHH